MKKINSVMGKRKTESGIPFRHCRRPRAIQGNVDTIPERPTVTGIGLDGSENFTSYPNYIW